jgi:RNA polymerase sigma factor (sigma-70 family)
LQPENDQHLSELMRRGQDGDGPAYEAVLLEVTALVRAFVRRRVRDPDSAEDVVQDVLLSIHRYRHTYDPERAFGPWMYAIAKNRLVDFIRKRRRLTDNEVSEDGWYENVRSEVALASEAPATALPRNALSVLSAPQREIIGMLKLEGRTVAEIAVKTGRSPSSVKVMAHRGYKKLRELLGRPDHDD